MKNNNIELLAPAGDFEKLKTAVFFGADAVYFGGELFSLRAGAGNFSIEQIIEAMDYLHENGKKGYMTINIYPHNNDLTQLEEYIKKLKDVAIDAFIISDIGVMTILKSIIPDAEIHLSTQANTTNYITAQYWAEHGIKRIVAARELSLEELREMKNHLPDTTDVEAFVHGAMCISYSGRCLLSNFMVGRDSNMGQCAHPCRWKYSLVEEQRPGEYYPIVEDDRGTYIMNSKDLCMIDSIPEIINAGVTSLKIEGRMKSMYYVATVVGAYRTAIDNYLKDPADYVYNERLMDDLRKTSNRKFTHGFYFGKPAGGDQNYITSTYSREFSFIGVVKGYDKETNEMIVQQRNKFCLGDTIEVFGPDDICYEIRVTSMTDEDGIPIESAPHPKQIIRIKTDIDVQENYLLRIREEEKEVV